MNVNPVLLGFTLGMCAVVIATLLYERKFVGDGGRAATPPAVPAPDQPAPVIPVSGAGTIDASGSAPAATAGVTTSSGGQWTGMPGERGQGCGVVGGSSTPTPVHIHRVDLGHGVTRVENWYCPVNRGVRWAKWDVTYAQTTITYDIYEVKS